MELVDWGMMGECKMVLRIAYSNQLNLLNSHHLQTLLKLNKNRFLVKEMHLVISLLLTLTTANRSYKSQRFRK